MRGCVALCLASCALAASSFCEPGNGWVLDWEDDFEGDTLNLADWTIVTTTQPNEDACCRDALCLADNVRVTNGTLVLTSDRTGPSSWSTGAVRTQGKKHWAQTPAFRLCVNAILPGAGGGGAGQGIWPAAWMMPDINWGCDPDEGEMDILEMVDGNGVVYGTYHWETTWPAKNCSYPAGHQHVFGQRNMSADWGNAFHEYAVERSASHVAYIYDGTVLVNASANATDPAAPLLWPFPFYFILNTAVGGSWPGNATSSTVFPTYYTIDSVRVVTQGAP